MVRLKHACQAFSCEIRSRSEYFTICDRARNGANGNSGEGGVKGQLPTPPSLPKVLHLHSILRRSNIGNVLKPAFPFHAEQFLLRLSKVNVASRSSVQGRHQNHNTGVPWKWARGKRMGQDNDIFLYWVGVIFLLYLIHMIARIHGAGRTHEKGGVREPC